ncbi:MAG: copper resistance CopC family protein [Ardenticatenaceae bacterium]
MRYAFWIGVLAVLALGGPRLRPAWAHAELRESEPAVGEVFRWERPMEVRLRFSQKLDSARIVVTDRQFEEVQQGEARVAERNQREAFIRLGNLQPATYTVTWRAVSVDGHPLDGSYEFTVLPREPLVTMIVAVIVLPLFGLLVYTRRARSGDEE